MVYVVVQRQSKVCGVDRCLTARDEQVTTTSTPPKCPLFEDPQPKLSVPYRPLRGHSINRSSPTSFDPNRSFFSLILNVADACNQTIALFRAIQLVQAFGSRPKA